MNAITQAAKKAVDALAPKGDMYSREPLNKATYVELFFDLVFIFCIRSIIPIVTDVEGATAGWYDYYTFWFTFALMVQVWFNSTIFMNRFGTGGVPDIVYLFTSMFLLFVMTQAISTGWENYAVYNGCWILITLNTMAHWVQRYRRVANPRPQLVKDTKLAMGVLGAQVILVLASNLFPKTPAQVVCLIAMLIGYLFWYAGGKENLDQDSCEHLAERCALLMVLTFGETLIGFGNAATVDAGLFSPIMYFLLISGMFLVYLNEIVNLLDLDSLRENSRRYMALSAWMTFCIANVTAGFEMSAKAMNLMRMSGDVYFGISVAVFLLCFFIYTPFNKYKRPSVKWTVARIIACVLVLAQSSTVAVATQRILAGTAWFSFLAEGDALSLLAKIMTVVAVAAIYAVLIIDRVALRRASQATE